jgi:uncharacterized membrane protein
MSRELKSNALAIVGIVVGVLVGVFVATPGIFTFVWTPVFAVLGFLLGRRFDRRRRT